MNIMEIIFIIFSIAIPPSIVVLFIHDKKEIIQDFKEASATSSKYKN